MNSRVFSPVTRSISERGRTTAVPSDRAGCVRRRQDTTDNHEHRRTRHGRRHHAPAPRERRPLRAPDPTLEPQDEALHHDRAQRHLHHRPPAVADLHQRRLRVRQADRRPRRHHPLRRHEEAGPGAHRRAGDARRDALRQPPLARWHADQLPDDLQAPHAPEGARGDRPRHRRRLGLHEEGAPPLPAREGQAREDPRRHPLDEQGPLRGLDRRHEEGAPRRRRGAQARPAGHRDPRHELRPGRGRLQDPGQRRRDPLRHAADPRRRRRRRRGPDGPLRWPLRCDRGPGRLRADGRVGARAARR